MSAHSASVAGSPRSSPSSDGKAAAASSPFGWPSRTGLYLAMLLLAVQAASFLPHQSLWVDETTQLAGVRLGVRKLLPWLAGRGPDLGVPPDRAPPLSYLVQMAWAAFFGGSEASFRWLSLLLTCAGANCTALAARRAYGPASALVALLFLALSPNVAIYAVEVRPYPLFFALSGAAVYLVVRAQQASRDDRARWLIALTAVLGLAIYTHFFGLVLAGAVGVALCVDAFRGRKPFAPVFFCGAGLGVVALGLLPFVAAAGRLSAGTEPASTGFRGVVRLVYRLYGHPALAASRIGTELASVGFFLGVVAGVFSRRATLVAVTLLAGLTVVCASTLLARGFDATAPHYNVWALPFVALLVASGLRAADSRLRALAAAGIAALLLGSGVGSLELHRRPDAYAHGPQRALIALVRQLGPERVMVVHDSGSEASGHVFFPLRFTFGRSLPQYDCPARCDRLVLFDPKDPAPASPRDVAIVVRTTHTSASALTRSAPASTPATSPAVQLLTSEGFHLESQSHLLATVSADVTVLRRDR